MRDIAQSARSLWKQPGSTIVAVVAFALGIGFSTALFSVLRGTLFPTLPFPRSRELMQVERKGLKENRVLPAELLAWQAGSTTSILTGWFEATASFSGDGPVAENYLGAYVSSQFFETVGVWPERGRAFSAAEDQLQAPLVVVIGHRLWQQRYQGDAHIAGRMVRIGGQPAQIVGVMPAGFRFPRDEDYWLPLGTVLAFSSRNRTRLEAFGRLRAGATAEQAAAELDVLARHLREAGSGDGEEWHTVVTPFVEGFTASARRPLLLITAAALAVLLIACANVTHLLLARGAFRARDMAIRVALGASRWNLAALALSESFVLSASGGLVGVAVAMAGVALYNGTGGLVQAFWVDIRIDPAALFFTVAAVGFVTFVCGAIPVLRLTAADPSQTLKDRQAGLTSRGLTPWSRALVVAQVALSCALLVSASQLVESVRRLYHHDLGSELERVWTATVSVDPESFPSPPDWLRFYDLLKRELDVVPGAEAVALASRLPPLPAPRDPVEIEGIAQDPAELPKARWSIVSPGFFAALSRPILTGRDFSPADALGAVPVVLVNRSFARLHFGVANPLGRRLRLNGGPWTTIVGVVPDLYLGWDDEGKRISTGHPEGIYFPVAQRPRPGMYLLQRTAVPPGAMETAARKALARLDPNVALSRSQMLAETLDLVSADDRMMRTLFATFGTAALILAGVGLYGVVSVFTGQRRKEMAIRMAVGANARHILGFVFREGGIQVGLGLLLGLPLAAAGSHFLRAWLYGLEPGNVLFFAWGAAALIPVACLACLIPAWRSVRVDPVQCLRSE